MSGSKEVKVIDEVRGNLQRMEAQFKLVLPSHVTSERFTRIAITAVQNAPDLLNVDRTSLYSAIMKSAQDGLLPDGREAAIVKFGNTAAYMPMVGGILKKVRNSGELATITSQIIHKNDAFKFWVDSDGEHLTHEPLFFGERGERIGVYALAKTKDGAVYIEVLTTAQVTAVKNVSRGKNNGPWAGPFEEEMWKKTAIRRLSKRLPMSTDLEDMIRAEDEMVDLDAAAPAQETQAAPVEERPKAKSSRLAQHVKAHTEEATVIPPVPEEETAENPAEGADII